jgi:hypothetical protein
MLHCDSSIERDTTRKLLNPRLAFNGVSARVFPLKASMNLLQDFCDNYLNFMDEDGRNRPTHYFKPAMPWVYCQVLNYGQMATATRSVGWISQHEVFFLVPLAWYVVEKGELRFKDWAMVCPFVFVDNDISITAGREHYGWVKVRVWLDRLDPNWADDATKARLLMDMRTELFPRVYAGERLEPRSLLQITEDPPPSVFRNPFGKQDMFGPAWSIPEAVRTSIGLVRDFYEYASGFPLQGYDPRSVPTTGEMYTRNAVNLRRLLPWWQPDRDTTKEANARAQGRGRNYYLNQITVKQFRDAAEPTYACYQALVNSRITIDHYYDGGLLGPSNVAFGDLTGGIRLLLHDYPEQQIHSTLGLEVSEWREGEHDHRVAVLIPQLPFWARYDLRYDNGDTLCWRTKTSNWHCDPCPERVCKDGRANEFDSSPGAAIQALYGPFVYPDVTVRVFPLKADRTALQRYCDDYLNKQGDQPPGVGELPTIGENYFEPWGQYVYMLVISHSNEESVGFSEGNNIGPIAGEQITFYLPVKWFRRDAPGGTSVPSMPAPPLKKNDKIYKIGLLTPYVFGEGRQVVSEREVNGVPSLYGQVTGGPDVWLNTFRGKERSVLAQLKTLLITALDAGQPAREETLIEVVSVPLPVLVALEAETPTLLHLLIRIVNWLRCLFRRAFYWILRGYLWFFSIVFLPRFLRYVSSLPLNYVSLKRVWSTSREAGKNVGHTTSYQAIVLVEKTIERLFAGRWYDKREWAVQRFVERLDQNIRIDIRYHETLDIAGTLGLMDAKIISRPGALPVQEFRPKEPFQIRLHLKERLGHNVQTKIHTEPWGKDIPVDPLNGSFQPNFPTGARLAELMSLANDDGPQRMIERYVRFFGAGGSCWRWH